MIYITEDIPEKLVGISSLFIYLDKPSVEIDQFIKSLGTYQFNNQTKEIEVPTNQLANLLDYLVYFDDVVFDALDYEESINTRKMKMEHKTSPLPHQVQAIEYGLNHNNFLLLDAPGLGKTLSSTCLAEELKKQEGIEHCLVICCVASLRTNWSREIDKHSLEDCLLLGARFTKTGNLVWDSIPKRVEQLMQPIKEFFVIMNIESLRSEKILEAIKHGPNKFGLIVVDEIHKCVDSNTLINTLKGLKPIKEIQKGDKVLSYNTKTNSIEYSLVNNIFTNTKENEILDLTFVDDKGTNYNLRCSLTHKIFTQNRGFIEAQDLTFNDIVRIDDLQKYS